MNKERREKAIAWLKDEIRSLERAPELNGCPMTPEWAAQLDIMRTCLEAVQDHFREVTKMVPLTLEQLREMDGKPAYWLKDDSWGIISGEKNPVWLYTHGWFEVTHWLPLPEPPAELEKRLRG